MKKIVFVSPKNTSGGAERVMTTLANEFSKKLYEVIFITFDEKSNFYKISNNVKVCRLNAGTDKYSKLVKIFLLPIIEFKRYVKLKKILRIEKPNCLVSFLFTSNIFSTMMCKKLNIPVILSERNDPNSYGKLKRKIMKHFYSKANGFVCQSSKMKDYAERNYKLDNVIYIPNPLTENQISKNIVEKKDKIITVGRLIEQKNQKLLINAFANIHNKFKNYKLYIYGEGEKRIELENYIKRLKLEKYVFLPGVEKDVLKNNSDSKLFVLPSSWEGYPNVLVEAMANGICSISSNFDSGSALDIINNGINGFLFENGNEKELTKIMESLLLDESKICEVAIKGKEIYKKINVNKIIKMWNKYIEEVRKD